MGLRWVESRQTVAQPDLPEPEQVFFSWLMAQPAERPLLAAATREAERLSRYSGSHEGPRKLARMFADLIGQLEKSERRDSRINSKHDRMELIEPRFNPI